LTRPCFHACVPAPPEAVGAMVVVAAVELTIQLLWEVALT
jgi:hypothetical protein